MTIIDHTVWLQQLLDCGTGTIVIPDGEYVVSSTLRVPDDTTVICSPKTTVRLADGANCPLLGNVARGRTASRNITIDGGVWDGNNLQQQRDQYAKNNPDGAWGQLVVFSYVNNLTLRNMTLKDPESFAVQLTAVDAFTVEDIHFDFNKQRPNMDGIHVNGFARNGLIRNLTGETHDDMVALNSDEGEFCCDCCDIENVTIENIYGGRDGWTGVRLLSRQATLRNIAIRNLYGGYKFNGVSFTHWGGDMETADYGRFENILLDGIFAYSCRTSGKGHGGIIWFQPYLRHVGTVVCRNIFRADPPDHRNDVPTVEIGDGVIINTLIIQGLHQQVPDEKPPLLVSDSAMVRHFVNGV
ncbi:MAG: glycosyl hydrolase family 28 protein [Armatimonadota bacterium]